eukprot:CAMPEP_0197881902 /NCGR_PEP_ID=MMETSP1439-20131203/9237_1 /TAXON_ID=66791 /ORGANISM="Gonyaulax spinifera, Strain CCMP409" /LENGTH=246 /DNA_ID=CAMNT_0043501537 /DNA_START=59 /DNA_END=796 /DNA_ORIENTATION=+
MGVSVFVLALLAFPAALQAAEQRQGVRLHANPIRKVVNMLQAMQKKVTEEGETEKALYEKFQCYCKTSGGSLSASIQDAEEKIPAVTSDIKSSEEQKAQVSDSLTAAQEDRSSAKAAVAQATAIREKEAAAYAATKAEYGANLDAINRAVAALEKGMAGAFLQTGAAQTLQKVLSSRQSPLAEEDRQAVLSFLGGGHGSEYAPQSGEITGILKQLGDEMGRGLSEATATEKAAIESYDNLMAAKKK